MDYVCTLNHKPEDKLKGYYLLTTLSELNRAIINADPDVTTNIYVRKDFIDSEGEGPVRTLFDNVHQVKKYVILHPEGFVPNKAIDHYTMLMNVRSVSDIIGLLSKYGSDLPSVIHDGLTLYSRQHQQYAKSQTIINTLLSKIEVLKRANEEHLNNDATLTRQHIKDMAILDSVYGMLWKKGINKGVVENAMLECTSNNYHKVLYLKEFSPVRFTGSLVRALSDTLSILESTSVRVVIMEPVGAMCRLPHYENVKFACEGNLTDNNVVRDNIVTFGYRRTLMETIASNPNKASFLIILDKLQYTKPLFIAPNVEFVAIADNAKDIPEAIPASRTLTYSKGTMHIPFIHDYDNMDNDEQLRSYSALSATTILIKMLRGG